MTTKTRKPLSLLLVLCMIISLFAGMTVPASAKTEGTISAETVTGYVLGKDGETKTPLASWTADRESDTYKDAKGNEIPGVQTANFANYGDGETQGYILYTGSDGGNFARAITVTKYLTADGIIRELAKLAGLDPTEDYDLIMSSTADKWTTTYGKGTTGSKFVSSTQKLYSSFNWLEACRANGKKSTGLFMTLEAYPNAVEVPAVLAICSWNDRINVGECADAENAAALKAGVEAQAAKADMANALRFVSGMDPTQTSDMYMNTGANSAKGVDTLVLVPTYSAFTVKDGVATGTEGAEGYSVAANHATVTTADNWFKAATGETVTLTVTPDSGYQVKNVYAGQGSADILVKSEGNNVYTFEMPSPEDGESVTVEIETAVSSAPTEYSVTVDSEITNGTVTVDKEKAAKDEIVTVTVTPSEGYQLKEGSLKYNDTVINADAGKYTFTMPEAAVIVTAEFEATIPAWNGDSIASAADFAAFAAAVNAGNDFSGKTVTLTDNIDLSSIADWTPVGSAEHPFAGTFDGAGKTVRGLTITDVTGGYHGLFGYNLGTVKDFSLSGTIGTAGAKITSGTDNIGGAVGYNDGTVSGVTGNVTVYVNTSSIYAVGGIVGQNGQTGVIQNCANTANIEATKAAGGVCGRSYGKIDGCYNTGNITGNGGGKDGIGGIVGIAGNKNSTYANSVTNCYNTGTISNNNGRWHGGIVGMADSAATVKNCYNVGTIEKGYSWNWNPIIGHVDRAYSTVSNNYSLEGLNAGDSDKTTKPLTIGTVKTEAEMKSADFVTELCGDGRAFVKDSTGGYPILRWQAGEDTATVTALTVESDPAKLTYVKGETFDPTGLKIKATWSDGTSEFISDYTVSNTDALTGNCEITVSATYGGKDISKTYNVTVITVNGIEITTPPTKTEYVAGQTFSKTGMVVTVKYSNDTTATTTSYTFEPSSALALGDTTVKITYTAPDNSTYTATQAITVIARALVSIEVDTMPTCRIYAADEPLDLTGMVIRAKFNDTFWMGDVVPEKTDEQDGYTWSLGADNKTVTISYTYNEVTKTASFEIERTANNMPVLSDGVYQIANLDDITWFANKVNTGKNAINGKLTADIALPDDWCGIGTSVQKYEGTLDGDGHTLTYAMTEAQDFNGFIEYLAGTVKNLTIAGTVVTENSSDVGVLVGKAAGNATLENCVNKASLEVRLSWTGSAQKIGGLVGGSQFGANLVIKNCVNEGSVTGSLKNSGGILGNVTLSTVRIENSANTGAVSSAYDGATGLGGIIGANGNNGTVITGCYNTGAVTGGSGLGGIVGMGNGFTVENCYNTGAVTANAAVDSNGAGGIVGTASGAITLKNSYNAGSITAAEAVENANLGGLVGYAAAENTVENSYFLGTEGEGAKTEAEMKSADFVTALGEAFKADTKPVNGGFPVLTWQPGDTSGGEDPTPPTPSKGDVNAPVWDGRSIDVSWYDPDATEYYISTPAQLAGLAAIVNGLYNKEIDTFKGDTSYIVANKVESEDSGPNGNNKSTSTYHYGADNFAGKTVYLTADIDMGEDNNYMPIGGQYLMTPNDSTTRIDASFCGVFDGQGHSVTIYTDRHCSTGNFGDGQSVGLIGRLGVHDNEDSQKPTGAAVRDVAVYGSVYANRSVGGVVGKTGRGVDTLIERCANFAAVKGTDSKGVGGICGAGWNGVTIRDCYNAGAVETTYGSGMTGGIAGSNEATIIRCYNVGKITAPAGNTTAAIASANGGDTYENCYWLSGSADVGVYDKTLDAVVEKTAAELKSAEMLELLGSAFAADTADINNGYPVLYWQSPGASEPDPEPVKPGETELPFTDVDGHWALDAIRYAYENKLFNGVSDTEFAPNTTMTRGMLVTVLYRLEGEPAVTANAEFSDVAEDQWYAKAVAWAAENEIVKGYGTTFGPNDLVTREQMATILLRYAMWKQYDTTAGGMALREYADYAEISGWATAALEWANAEGLILGRTETTIVPRGDATRAEVATILMRFIEKFAEK